MKDYNPFTLNFGKEPNEYISRYELIEAIINTFESKYPVSQAYLIEGIRGCGKTVMMTSVEKELAMKDDWLVVDLNSTQDLLTEFAMRLLSASKKVTDIFKKGFSVSIAGIGFGVNGDDGERDTISIIEEILSELQKKEKKVLIAIDEVMQGENMRHFASQFQIFLRKDYPVFLLMTGLYENINAIQNDPALTFLLRTPKIALDPLSLLQITKQYQSVFEIDLEQAKILARLTKGYAFAFQALGLLYFDYRDSLPLEKILLKFDDMLDDFVYRKIWETLSEQDRKIVAAMTDEKMKVGDICKKINMPITSFSKYRERLLKRGIILAPQHGYAELALPRFSSVVQYYV